MTERKNKIFLVEAESNNRALQFATEFVSTLPPEELNMFSTWYSLVQDLVELIEAMAMKTTSGVDKAQYVTKTIIETIQKLHIDNDVVNTILQNPDILTASTTLAKNIFNLVDKNKDGEISTKEWYSFFCCR